jgi:hypothetical protein
MSIDDFAFLVAAFMWLEAIHYLVDAIKCFRLYWQTDYPPDLYLAWFAGGQSAVLITMSIVIVELLNANAGL